MFDLVYPSEPAPLIGVSSVRGNAEILPIVEANGIVTGRSTRKACHDDPTLLHPVVHLHIIDRNSRIYLQKRASTKDLLPGYWDTAVGGHVTYGESLAEALFREAAEELGFVDFNPVYLDSYVYTNERENELVNVFATISGRLTDTVSSEVEEGRWWTDAELASVMGKGVLTPQFESEYPAIRERLFALL